MAKLWEKPCNFLNIKFWIKREKAIVQNSNSTNSLELPRCGPHWFKYERPRHGFLDLVTTLAIDIKEMANIYRSCNNV